MDLVALMIDGAHFAEHCCVVAGEHWICVGPASTTLSRRPDRV